ncbi:MAG: uracil-DNA glycosylase [Kiritimatiellae bacterium]|nr:uracil-DNA glycosylase [Kiritimatiellia bacterium]
MDCGFPDILNAFEQALELERELGTRTVDGDRALLAPRSGGTPLPPAGTPRSGGTPLPLAGTLLSPAGASRSGERTVPLGEAASRRFTGTTGVSPVATPALPTAAELAACTRCDLHGLGRTHVVPGQGNADSPDFMFVGEAPGADEDRQGLAFVGAAGQFLTKMIAAMGYTRDQVFIANICKCRPPNNRTPSPPEMAACVPYLKRQIARIRPKCLILLGNTAMRGLFPDTFMRRGQWQMYEGIPAIGTFHPAYILRFDSVRDSAGLRKAKTEVWNTLKLALARLGKTPPAIQRKGQTT